MKNEEWLDMICSIMASDGFRYTMKYCFANTPASIRESPGIPVFYASLTSGDHGIGGSTGEWEAHCLSMPRLLPQ